MIRQDIRTQRLDLGNGYTLLIDWPVVGDEDRQDWIGFLMEDGIEYWLGPPTVGHFLTRDGLIAAAERQVANRLNERMRG